MHDLTAAQSTISLLVIWTALSVLAGWRLLARVPWEPRRPVPWNLLDVLVVLGAYVLLFGTLVFAARWGLGIPVGTGSESPAGGSQAAGAVGEDHAAAGGKNRRRSVGERGDGDESLAGGAGSASPTGDVAALRFRGTAGGAVVRGVCLPIAVAGLAGGRRGPPAEAVATAAAAVARSAAGAAGVGPVCGGALPPGGPAAGKR